MCFRPARAAFRRPSGFSLVEPPGRIAPAGGPPALSLPCKGPPQHTRTVPGSRRTLTTNDASFPGLSRSSTRTGTVDPLSWRGFRPRACRVRFGYLLRDIHHRPCGRLAAPEHPRASPFQAFSSRRSASLSGDPALVTLRASIRLAPRGSRADGAAFRALIPTSSSFLAPLAGRRVEACLGFTPPELSLLPSSRARCSPRTVPQHALGGIDVPTRLRLGVFRCGRPGIAPLGVAGSPGVSYLSTVAAPLRPPRGTSV